MVFLSECGVVCGSSASPPARPAGQDQEEILHPSGGGDEGEEARGPGGPSSSGRHCYPAAVHGETHQHRLHRWTPSVSAPWRFFAALMIVVQAWPPLVSVESGTLTAVSWCLHQPGSLTPTSLQRATLASPLCPKKAWNRELSRSDRAPPPSWRKAVSSQIHLSFPSISQVLILKLWHFLCFGGIFFRIRKIKEHDSLFSTKTFAEQAQEIFIEAHRALTQ